MGIVPVMLPSHENWKREIGSTNQPAAGVLVPSQLFSSTTSPVTTVTVKCQVAIACLGPSASPINGTARVAGRDRVTEAVLEVQR